MKLSNASIYSDRLEINGKTCNSMAEFISELKSPNNLVADVYVNGNDGQMHLLFSSKARFLNMNGYFIASVDGSFALSSPAGIDTIEIIVHESGKSDSYVMTSTTNVNEYIEVGDQDADLYFAVCNITPYNSNRQIVPESRFHWLESSRMIQQKIEDLPTDDSIEVDESTYGIGYYPRENSTMTLTSVIPGTDGNYTVTVSVSEEPNPDGSYGVTVGLSNSKSFVGSIKPNDNNQVSADSLNSLVDDSDESKSLSSYITCEGYIDIVPFIGNDVSIEMTGGEDSIESDDDQTDHIVTVNFDAHKQASFDDGNGNTLTTYEWNISRDSQLDFWVVANDAWPSDETPVIVVDETGELLRRDSESDNPPYYQFHIRKADIENIENRSEIILYIQFASYSTDSNPDSPSLELPINISGISVWPNNIPGTHSISVTFDNVGGAARGIITFDYEGSSCSSNAVSVIGNSLTYDLFETGLDDDQLAYLIDQIGDNVSEGTIAITTELYDNHDNEIFRQSVTNDNPLMHWYSSTPED